MISGLLILSLTISCVQSMEEVQSYRIAGAWGVVDEYGKTSRYLVFKEGYIHEYESYGDYFVNWGILWGAESAPVGDGNTFKYSFYNGVIHYWNHYKDVTVSLTVDGDMMMLGDERCLRINHVDASYFSTIILPKTNRRTFHARGEDVEWDFEIENPVEGLHLRVAEAPSWCGGTEGVTVEEGKIRFYVQPITEPLQGKFVFTYPAAQDVEVEVKAYI